MRDEKLIDFCSYIQPILSGCLGFIKSDGYFSHIPGMILAMSSDETVFAAIKIPVIYDIYVTSLIGRILQLKTPEEQSNLYNEVYFTGWNVKYNSLINYQNIYCDKNDNCCIFYEPDCYTIQNFTEAVANTSISTVFVSDGINMYRIPASKSITPLNKSDSASLKIYNCAFDYNKHDIKTINYIVYKKKFKLDVNIYTNILIV